MTKLAGDHVQVLVDGYELTADSHTLSITDSVDQHDVTAFGDAVHHFVNGVRMFSVEHQGYLNPAAARSHPVLQANAVDGVLSIVMGQNTAPTDGDPAFVLQTLQTSYATTPEVNSVVPFTAQFANLGREQGGWGVALAVPTTFTDTKTGSVINAGSTSSNGGVAVLHILTAAASDTYTVAVEGSTTGAFSGEETTLATFTLDASALGSERIVIAGTIPQYTRFVATRSGLAGDTVQMAVNLIRF